MENKIINKKILLTGGGTGGSVSPLLAIAESLSLCPPLLIRRGDGRAKQSRGEVNFLFLGTKYGPEKEMTEGEGIEFKAIHFGKFRRYFSFKNFTDLFWMKIGFFQSFFIILKWKPDLIISAGSFVSVPVVWAGWILGVPILIHQQDARAGLANKLMAPFARVITVTFEESLRDYGKKAVWTGNISRNMKRITHNAKNLFFGKFENNFLTVLVIGGGTGAVAINELVQKSLSELTKFCNVIHITGRGKKNDKLRMTNYESFEFLNAKQMAEAYSSCDLVVSRAGLGVLTELSYLGKPAILIPMPDSHQEDNAKVFNNHEAVIVLNQKNLTSKSLVANIRQLLADEALKSRLSENIKKVIKKDANSAIIKIINQVI